MTYQTGWKWEAAKSSIDDIVSKSLEWGLVIQRIALTIDKNIPVIEVTWVVMQPGATAVLPHD